MDREREKLIRLQKAARLRQEADRSRLAALLSERHALLAGLRDLEPIEFDSADPALQMADFRHRLWAAEGQRRIAERIRQQDVIAERHRAAAARATARCSLLERMILSRRRDQLS